jgi:hypothetical protein
MTNKGQVYWEDVSEGQELPEYTLLLDPLRVHLQSSGTQDFHRQHNDEEFAHKQGVQHLFMNTGFSQAALARVVLDWMGDEGFLKKFKMEMRKMHHPGDVMTLRGKVVRTWEENGEALAECEVWAENDREGIATPGRVVVALPHR